MAISNLVLTRQIYSEEKNGAHAHYREPVPLTLLPFHCTMDVLQLFANLKKEAECPLCLETVNNRKTLSCIHSFCLECLDKHANFARRQLQATIKCPVCQTSFQIPEGDSFKNFPTSYHLNRLVDVLALKRWRHTGPEMQQLWWEQHRFLLLFRLSNIRLCCLFWSSSATEDHKRSSQCCDREIASARCSRVDPQTRHVFTAISRKSTAGILLWRMQSSYLPQVQCGCRVDWTCYLNLVIV